MLYFAYGSNMDPAQMERRCPGAGAIGPARLDGYRLAFTRDSASWGGGVATVEPEDGSVVWGVLWDLDEGHVAALDLYEAVAAGMYRQEECIVDDRGERREAMIYVANPGPARPPSSRYVGALVRGAEAFGLPDDYVGALRRVSA